MTARGESQARIAGLALARMQASFEAILFSPKVRARQTAELAAEALPASERARMASYPPLAGRFGTEQAFDALAGVSTDGRLLLVGHEPDLSNLLAELTGARADVKKGGLAIVRLEGARAELTVLMRPRELALVAGDDALRGGDAVGAVGAPLGGE